MKYVAALCSLVLFGCSAANMQTATRVASDVSGTWSGHMENIDQRFPLSFNIVIDLHQKSHDEITGTVVRSKTDCWDETPMSVKGDLIDHFQNGKVNVREIALSNVDGTVVMKGPFDSSAKNWHLAYNSIVPNTRPCESIAALGELRK